MFLLYISSSFLQTPITNTSSLLLPMCSSDKTSHQRTSSHFPHKIPVSTPKFTTDLHKSPFPLPSILLRWMNCLLPLSPLTIFTCNLGHILSHLTTTWLPQAVVCFYHLRILSFGSFAWAHSFVETKITRKKNFFNPIFPSSYHPFLCSSLQQNSCKTCPHTWSPLPFLPISLEAIRDFVPTNLHWNPLDTVRWTLLTTTPLPIQWPILSTCLTSL